ncbi:MAG TPA: pitrilysin family protein [Polyangiaceae bacterium]|nr:pitrilysin family protein [Polyangiaceae bacterium]
MTNTAPARERTPKVLVETSRELPLVSVSVALRTGAILDPPEAQGAMRFLARLMRRSAGGRSADANDRLIEGMGGSLGAEVSQSALVFQGTVIARSLDRFVEALVDTIVRPTLPDEELERLRRETEAELKESLDDDRGLVNRWFRRRIFPGHPYSRSSGGTLGGVRSVTGDMLKALYRRAVVADNLLFAFSGDITEERAQKIAETLAGAVGGGPAPADDTPEPSVPPGRRLVFVDKPERSQTQILIGGLGSHPADPDHVALSIANTAFGGTFTARLMQEVRAKRGWSYGAYSNLPFDRQRQAFSLWTFPKASDAPACIALELEMLRAFREKGLTSSEFGWAKRYLVRSHAFALDTAAKRVGLTLDTELYNLPTGYYSQYVENLGAATLELANQAVRERLSDENILFSVVGTEQTTFADVKAAIPNLSSADVVRYDAE